VFVCSGEAGAPLMAQIRLSRRRFIFVPVASQLASTVTMRWECDACDQKQLQIDLRTYFAVFWVCWWDSSTTDGCDRAVTTDKRYEFVRDAPSLFVWWQWWLLPSPVDRRAANLSGRWGVMVAWFRCVGVGFGVSYGDGIGRIRRHIMVLVSSQGWLFPQVRRQE
jgi:hypothetical protein